MARTKYSTYMSIKQQLLEMFKTVSFEKNKLPSEPALAEKLGISLVTLREALLMLALEGYISKRHGSGNYLHPSTFDFENRSLYFVECLKKNGYHPSIITLDQNLESASQEVSAALNITPGDTVVKTHVLYQADENPAIYTVMHIPMNLLAIRFKKMEFAHIHEMVNRYCDRELAHSLNEYFPLALEKNAANILNLPENTPVIGCKQVFYDIWDTPVLFNEHRFNPNYYSLKTLQNWDFNQ